ncbi:MAG TPA: 3-hydroxyacyl-CoA dehydrogenase NAD-binding domain-containing protein, partial [Sphingomonas sp.]
METVGVIGAGQMGAGIAQVAAQAGYRVLLSDRELSIAENAKAGIAKRLGSAVEKGKLAAAGAEAALGRLETAGGYAAFGAAFLVIEAATEREEIKRAIFADVGAAMKAGPLADSAILATNTSSIPITRLAQAAPDP